VKIVKLAAIMAGLWSVLAACEDHNPARVENMDAYVKSVEEWRDGRLERLKGRTGYLNLVGLYWLQEGENTAGSDAGNDLVFPEGIPAYLGSLELVDGEVTMKVADGVDVFANGEPVREVAMGNDTAGNEVLLTTGGFAWYVVEREGRFGVRVRNYDLPGVADFPPIDHFPVDPAYRVNARFLAYDEPRIVTVATVIDGVDYLPECPGIIEFDVDGETQQLEVYKSDDGTQFFIIFADATTGGETYPAGRFVYTDWPDEHGITVLDLNKSYNPPCAFNDFATCPVASPRNRLKVAIRAGEKYHPSMHLVKESY
jgi:uncharacterized protein (DUF1684 family)